MYFAVFVWSVAILVSTISAYFSVIGMAAIFAAMPIHIMAAIGSLELSKLCLTSWLYRHWKDANRILKSIFSGLIVVLMLITSLGVFGLFSKAHFDQTVPANEYNLQVQRIDQSIVAERSTASRSAARLKQLDGIVQTLIDYDKISGKTGANAIRESQKEERQFLQSVIDNSDKRIENLLNRKLEAQSKIQAVEAKTGPIKYVVRLFHSDNVNTEDAVVYLILIIVLIFDPIAVLMVIAANASVKNKSKEEPRPIETEPELPPVPSISEPAKPFTDTLFEMDKSERRRILKKLEKRAEKQKNKS